MKKDPVKDKREKEEKISESSPDTGEKPEIKERLFNSVVNIQNEVVVPQE